MVSLIDSLLPEQWKEVTLGEKGDGFAEYHLNRQRNHPDPNTLRLFLTNDDGDPITAMIKGTKPNDDPFKAVNACEFKLKGEEVVGIDICGDVVLKKT
ncbi:uncharacterized protein [Mytilus edulis]|uniref:uncharacterized protein n=1 Tax=Mytilus edulis TaxID=6550 RepID=UPI0039EFA784